MKKNFKRKNYVLIGAIGIAAVALTSVGFATWITGITSEPVTTDGISIEVDTVNNKTSYIEAAVGASEKITIGESNVSSATEGDLYVESAIGYDFDVVFTSFRVITSTNFDIESVAISLAIYETSGDESTVVDTEGVGIYPVELDSVTNTDKKTYIALGKSALTTGQDGGLTPISSGQDGYVDGYNCYTLTGMKLSFDWGSLFNSKKPTEYYNARITSASTIDEKLRIAQEASSRLTKMNEHLSGKTLKITFTLNGDYNS